MSFTTLHVETTVMMKLLWAAIFFLSKQILKPVLSFKKVFFPLKILSMSFLFHNPLRNVDSGIFELLKEKEKKSDITKPQDLQILLYP